MSAHDYTVTFHLTDGTTLPGGDTDQEGLDSLRRALDQRTRPDGIPAGEIPHDNDGRRTLVVGPGKPRGYIVPAASVLYIRWEPCE